MCAFVAYPAEALLPGPWAEEWAGTRCPCLLQVEVQQALSKAAWLAHYMGRFLEFSLEFGFHAGVDPAFRVASAGAISLCVPLNRVRVFVTLLQPWAGKLVASLSLVSPR